MARVFLKGNYSCSEKGTPLLTLTINYEKVDKIIHYIFTENMMSIIDIDEFTKLKEKVVENISSFKISETGAFVRENFNGGLKVLTQQDVNSTLKMIIHNDINDYIALCKSQFNDSSKLQVITDFGDYDWVKFIDFVFDNYNTNYQCEHLDINTLFRVMYPSIKHVDRIGFHTYDIACAGYHSGIKEYEEKNNLAEYSKYKEYDDMSILDVLITKSCYDKLLAKFNNTCKEVTKL